MQTKVSEVKLISSIVLFAASVICAYKAVFFTTAPNTATVFVMAGIVLGRISVLLFKSARQKIS